MANQQEPDQITPKALYLNRRQFLKQAALFGAGLTLAACVPGTAPGGLPAAFKDEITEKSEALNFINYYEFSLSKRSVTELAKDFSIEPWQVEVGGLVANPVTYTIPELIERFKIVERTYRMRCVEGYSMVLPWSGFLLSELLEEVQPLPEAKFVAFESVLRPEEMPGQVSLRTYPWPYQEGLRLDEAMHNLTIMATGMYSEPLSKQNGAPLRVVVPWKYGFKSPKAIQRITLTAEQPPTLWNTLAPQEYGFLANVNPSVDHPRWSQATELRLGEGERRPTLLFNGYDEVASLYEDIDLTVEY
ncbi:MAG TPA: protein-methionine-sulfoxide reductase catalytic subunit MsrP [Anaerolineaceae bacterium]|nr:protein-methionine-sulfoxide reductase catalytic subunit MsrP [Anaerolineaceae bacterium]